MLSLPMIESRFPRTQSRLVLSLICQLSAVLFFVTSLELVSGIATAQSIDQINGPNAQSTPPTISLKGIVTAQQKYSFTVLSDGKEYNVKLAENASVGLLMNRPYFDWKAEKVFVQPIDPNAIPDGSENEDANDSDKSNRIG